MVISAPIASRPFKCWSTGREPMAQPPGRLTCASPKRARVGPSTRIEARMVFTNSYGAQMLLTVPPLISNSWMLSVNTRAPMPCSSFWVVFTSRSMGTFFRRKVPSVSKPAHISGRAAFLAPDTMISPFKGPLAEILSLSIKRALSLFFKEASVPVGELLICLSEKYLGFQTGVVWWKNG